MPVLLKQETFYKTMEKQGFKYYRTPKFLRIKICHC